MATVGEKIKRIVVTFFRGFVKAYQLFCRPFFGQHCRFHPRCSDYMLDALEKHQLKGIWIGLKRILRCHPWHEGGFDPVTKNR